MMKFEHKHNKAKETKHLLFVNSVLRSIYNINSVKYYNAFLRFFVNQTKWHFLCLGVPFMCNSLIINTLFYINIINILS